MDNRNWLELAQPRQEAAYSEASLAVAAGTLQYLAARKTNDPVGNVGGLFDVEKSFKRNMCGLCHA